MAAQPSWAAFLALKNMKFSDLTLTPRVLRVTDAERYVGGQRNLATLRAVGWVKPIIQHRANTSFDIRDLDRAIDRVQIEGWPKSP
jgi:hypothetical protein